MWNNLRPIQYVTWVLNQVEAGEKYLIKKSSLDIRYGRGYLSYTPSILKRMLLSPPN